MAGESISRYVLYTRRSITDFFPIKIQSFDTLDEAENHALEVMRKSALEEVERLRSFSIPVNPEGLLLYANSITIQWHIFPDGTYLGYVQVAGTMTESVIPSFGIRQEREYE